MVGRDVAVQGSLLLRDLLDDEPTTAETIEIPLELIDAPTLQRCVEHMNYRFNNRMRPLSKPLKGPLGSLLDQQDQNFTASWDEETTILTVKAACFLNDIELKDLASAKLAQFLIDKSIEEIRMMLGVEGDFTEEEEVALRKEHGLQNP